ncbi:30S ribosome-binding factor RbfA [Methylocella sp.]|uniref:30S ribosome-binding factor RbfA n=1 Tax=Methylocella sp. TaxID=1978226 RepID=UPI0035B21BC7
MLRVGELVRHAMSELLTRGEIDDPALEGRVVTVPDVRMSPDLKLATVYVMPLGGERVDEVLAALERHKKFLRGEIAQRVHLRFSPDVRFKPDRSFEYGGRIDALLNSPAVRRDLESTHDEEEADDADGFDGSKADGRA